MLSEPRRARGGCASPRARGERDTPGPGQSGQGPGGRTPVARPDGRGPCDAQPRASQAAREGALGVVTRRGGAPRAPQSRGVARSGNAPGLGATLDGRESLLLVNSAARGEAQHMRRSADKRGAGRCSASVPSCTSLASAVGKAMPSLRGDLRDLGARARPLLETRLASTHKLRGDRCASALSPGVHRTSQQSGWTEQSPSGILP